MEYSITFDRYWDQIEMEMKKANPALYAEFGYLIAEQKNYNKMKQITLEYLLRNKPDELKRDGKLHRLVPMYLNYQQAIHRELREISEYNTLFLENESYAHNVKNPDYERLQAASQLLSDIKNLPDVVSIAVSAQSKGDVGISELECTLAH